MTKSIINALLGVRSLQGKLDVKDSLALKKWENAPNDERNKISIASFLAMSSGLEFAEVNGAIGSSLKYMM